MKDSTEIILALMILIATWITTWAWAYHTVATECERLGAFYVNEKTFNCQLKSGDTP